MAVVGHEEVARVRVRVEDAIGEHLRRPHLVHAPKVGAVARAASNLIETVGPDGARPDNFKLLVGVHAASPRIVLAASNTARMILS